MFIGEAKALRALYYMNLVAFWGEVPLRLEVVRDLSQQQLKNLRNLQYINKLFRIYWMRNRHVVRRMN